MTDLITVEEAGKLAHKYRFANNDLERVLCETARTVIALHAQLADAQAAMALVVERCADMIEDNVRHAKGLGREIWAMPDLRDLAPIDGLALVQELRADRDAADQRAGAMLARIVALEADGEAARSAASTNFARAVAAEADRDRLAAANAVLEAKVAGLRDFIDEFAKAKIDALRYSPPCGSSPEDEPDPVVDAKTVWAWQADAKAALATQEAGTC